MRKQGEVFVVQRPRVPSVGGGHQARRFDEAEHAGRDGHAHVVAPAQQFPTDRGAGFDVPPTSIARQYEFQR
ncbi:hypothetical protein MPRM_12310 [Mycobacterium parmense]|uniref:Uncharacterized protein n=1 Tax=Mycobacterium parmense TaxID=185642 RepID=A0A7I7YQB3_9MYCO|nr:hypothetical protein MPRM_12310 [Mycobacterium parmense]